MTTAYLFWTILGSIAGVGVLLVVTAYLVWRCYLHPKNKETGDSKDSFFEEITETEIKTVTSHPPDGATVVTQNVRTRTMSSRPRGRRGSRDPKEMCNKPDTDAVKTILVTPWTVPSLMNNWRESEEDFVKQMSQSNFKELPWKAPFSLHSPRVSKSRQRRKSEDKLEIVELA